MKIRNGFVSNSSSSSFIVIGEKSSEFWRGIDYAMISDENIKRNILQANKKFYDSIEIKSVVLINQQIENVIGLPLYITSYISDGTAEWSQLIDTPTAYEYCNGGFGGPYDEDNFVCLNDGNVWILKEHYKHNDKQYMTEDNVYQIILDVFNDEYMVKILMKTIKKIKKDKEKRKLRKTEKRVKYGFIAEDICRNPNDPIANLYEFLDKIGKEIVITRTTSINRFRVDFKEFCEVSEKEFSEVVHGFGNTIEDALYDFISKIQNKKIVFNAYGENRKGFIVPCLI